MAEQYVHFAYPILILILALFFIYRLKITQSRDYGGVGLIYTGIILTFLAAVMNLIEQHPDYSDWFLEGVYPIIIISEFAIFAAGLIMFVFGLAIYFSHWGDRIVEVESHIDKLKLLEYIQQECRPPFPVPELLNRVVGSMLHSLDEKAGAAFLFNPESKSFTLATAAGITEEEIALLKDYQYGRNVVSESIDNAIPLITSDFRSFGGKAQLALSRFNSLLILPMISGKTRLGAVLFFSVQKRHYSEEFISVVMPIIGWLSAKIEITQMNRIIRKRETMSETSEFSIAGQLRKLKVVIDAVAGGLSINLFAEKCKALFEADDAWIIGLRGGELIIHGGTAERGIFSDNFQAALINALTKNKAVILNQEDSGASGKSVISRSSILYPINKNYDAILMVKRGGPISMAESDMKVLDLAAALAGIILDNDASKGAGNIRRKGFEILNDILRIDAHSAQPEQVLKNLFGKLAGILSAGALTLLFRRAENHFEVIYSNIDNESAGNIVVAIGEGGVGRIAALKFPEYESGAAGISQHLEQYHEENRILIKNLFADKKGPLFLGNYPILMDNRVNYVASIYDFKSFAVDNSEIHQLLSILFGLYNLKMELVETNRVHQKEIFSKAVKTPSVLIIADEPVILDLVTSMCRSIDCRVRAAGIGSEALSIFESSRPDFVIIDLAVIDGSQSLNISDLAQKGVTVWDIASRIKAISSVTPVIAMVGWGIAAEERKLKELGFDFILQKPFRLEQLHEIIFAGEKTNKNA